VAAPRYVDKAFVRALNIGARVRRLFKSAGLVDAAGRTPRPYVLRQYFLNRCLEAQSRTGVPDRFVEHWAGHQGDVTAKYYTTGLPHLPESMIEEMRAAYRKCEPFLSTAPSSTRGASNAEAYRVLLSAWYTDEEIAKVDLDDAAAVIDALRKGAAKGAIGPTQRVVEEKEVPALLEAGWVSKGPFNGSRWIVERGG
jgi:hypothetical protein